MAQAVQRIDGSSRGSPRAVVTKVAAAAGEPLKEQVKRGVDELRKKN